MFDGVSNDHFHQLIASRNSLPINPLSLPLHGNPNPSFSAPFDPLISTSLAFERERSMDPWSNDEVLALLKVRSSMDIWFPDFTWEHVSRKLAELGFKRSAEQCKEKFERENRHFSSVSYSNKSYRIFGELDEFYPANQQEVEKQNEAVEQDKVVMNKMDVVKENSANYPSRESEEVVKKPSKTTKRKRKDKCDMFKGFCETVVNKLMAQQEELHKKLIEDIVRRDEEKMAREEAWKNQEMDRIKSEIEMRAKEQANAGERQATIIEFLKKFTTTYPEQHLISTTTSLCKILEKNPSTSILIEAHQNPSSLLPSSHQNKPKDSETSTPKSPQSPSTSSFGTKDSSKANNTIVPYTALPSNHLGDTGKRWPRDEVLALINLRCKMSNNNSSNDEIISKEGAKGPLWERISHGMLEMGYKRSAKRCKEKWENINKYFRKTKDSNKKRSIDSRTCPYFHQLSCLYSEGTLVAPTNVPENQ